MRTTGDSEARQRDNDGIESVDTYNARMRPIRFIVNDAPVEVHDVHPTTTLLDYLRGPLGLTGTKEGCAEGDCGACTVTIQDGEQLRAVNACLVLLGTIDGQRITTCEGLVRNGAAHPAQQAMVECLGSQCGYCTPGIVMSLVAAAHRDDLGDAAWKLDDQLCGNLCRCTGYRPIRDAARRVAGTQPDDGIGGRDALPREPLHYTGGGGEVLAPTSLDELLTAVADHADYTLVAGATDLGIDVTQRFARWDGIVALGAVDALRTIEAASDGSGWSIGAGIALSELERWADGELPVLARMLRFFGSRQIKNRATLGGNLCNASPIGDTPPVLLALDATIVIERPGNSRRVAIDEFFLDYRKTALEPGEVLTRIEIPRPANSAKLGAYKVSKRREMDISAVAAAMRVELGPDGKVALARLAYGGMAATPLRAAGAEAALVGRAFDDEAIDAARAALADDFTPMSDHRGSAWYRSTLASNLLRGFLLETRDAAYRPLPDRPVATVTGSSS